MEAPTTVARSPVAREAVGEGVVHNDGLVAGAAVAAATEARVRAGAPISKDRVVLGACVGDATMRPVSPSSRSCNLV